MDTAKGSVQKQKKETIMTTTIKSVTPVQRKQTKGGLYKWVTMGGKGGWDVRVRFDDGTERLLCNGDAPYTLHQAQATAAQAPWQIAAGKV
jgi:hypothetical protein